MPIASWRTAAASRHLDGDVYHRAGTVDMMPPTVSITAPGNGATVSGAVTVSANATDNVAVASVQFEVDGANVGSPVTSAPIVIMEHGILGKWESHAFGGRCRYIWKRGDERRCNRHGKQYERDTSDGLHYFAGE